MFKKILIALLYFSPLLWRGAGGEAFAQQLSPFDSVLVNLQKAKTTHGIDTAYIVKAFSAMGSLKISDEQYKVLQNEALKFKGIDNDDYYFAVKTFAWNTYLKPETYLVEIESGKQLLAELGDCKTDVQRCCLSSFFSILRIPFRNSNKIYDGFDFFSQKLSYYLQKNDSDRISDCYFIISGVYRTLGLKDQQIYNLQKSIEYINSNKVRTGRFPFIKNYIGKQTWANQTAVLGSSYLDIGDYKKAMAFSLAALQMKMDSNVPVVEKLTGFIYGNIGQAYMQQNKMDSAKYFFDKAFTVASKTKIHDDYAEALFQYGIYFYQLNKIDSAENYFSQCIQFMQEKNLDANSTSGNITPRYFLSLISLKQNKFNDAIQLIVEEMPLLQNLRQEKLRDLKLLAEIYSRAGDEKKSNETYQQFINLQEQLNADEKKNRSISYDVEAKIAASEKEMKGLLLEKQFATKSRNYLVGIVALILLIAIGLLNRYLSKNKTNKQLSNALDELKSTQQQLVQQEKLASLGALTAGIAHEIKNPLNFVNNFSELSTELIKEFKESNSEEERLEILSDLELNLQKINHHGKRADSIVKNMLQHSRSGTAEKQLTNINQLCEEYFNIAFHGKRANDQAFNCEMIKNLDNNLPQVNCVTQDISRVILNLINNAFDAVRERDACRVAGNAAYSPTVQVITEYIPSPLERVRVRIRDNGNGIPSDKMEKIFEPFYTTKPAGQGTGLGLSLSFDIIKAHGGELKVESKEGEGSEFIITLPVV